MPGELTDDENEEIAAYGTQVLGLANQLIAGVRRYTAIHNVAMEHGDSPGLWAARLSECESWRDILDAIPASPPAAFAGTHARVLRWAAAIAKRSSQAQILRRKCQDAVGGPSRP